MEAILVKDQKAAAFVMEDGTFEGVYRITEKVCGDVEQVTGVRPKIIKWQGELQPAQVYWQRSETVRCQRRSQKRKG